jgi:hypothetical protein
LKEYASEKVPHDTGFFPSSCTSSRNAMYIGCPGKANLRKLLLVPIYSIPELTKRIKENAPEMYTMYFHELMKMMDEAEKKWG